MKIRGRNQMWECTKCIIYYGDPLHLPKECAPGLWREVSVDNLVETIEDFFRKQSGGFQCAAKEISANQDRIFICGDQFLIEYQSFNPPESD